MQTEATAEQTVHAFEKAGLGKAPFRFIGMERKVGPVDCGGGLSVGAPGQPMGTCDFCGTGIAECCEILSADGKRFVVGNTCVAKTGDKGLIAPIKKMLNAARAAKKAEKDNARIAAAKALYADNPAIREALSVQPHPNEYRASQGLTKADYVDWMFQNAGTSGQLSMAWVIEETAKGVR